MKCELCKKQIEKYDQKFNHLKINESLEVDICQSCIDKFAKWQQETIASLFPTKTLKKFQKK